MLILSIVLGILLFMFLVLIHEFWHFFSAKRLWIKVLEFGLWIPPKIKKIFTDKSWTEYTLNAIPLWWFVRLKWDEPNNPEDFNAPDSFMNAKLWKQTIVLLAWIFMNFLFAFVVLIFLFHSWMKPFVIVPENVSLNSEIKQKLVDNSLIMTSFSNLYKKWFLSWNILVKVDWVVSWGLAYWKISTWDTIIAIDNKKVFLNNFQKELANNFWKKISLTYQTKTWLLKKTYLTCWKDNCLLWVLIDIPNINIKLWLLDSLKQSLKEIYYQVYATFGIMWEFAKNLLTLNSKEVSQQVKWFSWPVWIVKIFYDIFSSFDWKALFLLFALISIALWAFNLLPIPALDWWRLLSVIIQKTLRLPKEKYFIVENYINIFFFVLLMWFGIFIIFQDLNHFWWISL